MTKKLDEKEQANFEGLLMADLIQVNVLF